MNSDIEEAARDLQARIWEKRGDLFANKLLSPLDVLEPEIAAKVLGIEFDYCEELGRFGHRGTRFEVAGLLDRRIRRISVASRFPPGTIRFTGAHEIGHWLLHPKENLHRDRPIKGLADETSYRRPDLEIEADHFAACFLVPRKLAIRIFQSAFSTSEPFVFDDAAAFWLCPDDPESLRRPHAGSLARALALASAQSYGGKHFDSLAKHFRVSVTTMAIRLRELGLIQE